MTVTVHTTDYSPVQGACRPNCGDCVPCLRERLANAETWRDRFQDELVAIKSRVGHAREEARRLVGEFLEVLP